MSRILYIIRDTWCKSGKQVETDVTNIIFFVTFLLSRTRQADPVIHQAHTGLAVAGDQAVKTLSVDCALVLNLHTISLVKAVLDIGENAAKGLQCLPLGRNEQVPGQE